MRSYYLLSFFVWLSVNALPAQSTIDDFLMYDKTTNSLERFLDLGQLDSVKKLIQSSDERDIPKDFVGSYYASCAEYFLVTENERKFRKYLKKFVLMGQDTFSCYLDSALYAYYEKHYAVKNERIAQMLKRVKVQVPLWQREKEYIDPSCVKACLGIYKDDQRPRIVLQAAIKNATPINKDSLLQVMEFIDKRNLQRYDSLTKQYGWLEKGRFEGGIFWDCHVVLAHGPSKSRYFYVEKGFGLACRNKIPWAEIIEMESFAFTKSEKRHENIVFVENFKIPTERKVNTDFNRFIAYCLFSDLTDGGAYNGHEKRAKLFINANDTRFTQDMAKDVLNTLRNLLGSFDEDVLTRVDVDAEDCLIRDAAIDDFSVGVEYQ